MVGRRADDDDDVLCIYRHRLLRKSEGSAGESPPQATAPSRWIKPGAPADNEDDADGPGTDTKGPSSAAADGDDDGQRRDEKAGGGKTSSSAPSSCYSMAAVAAAATDGPRHRSNCL